MENFVGEIRIFAGNYAPEDWALCNGQLLNISQYQVLYALIGTTYGGDGVNTFALPDLRGRVPIGVGQGTGLTMRQLGQSGGAEVVALSEAQIPSHNHGLTVNNTPATTPTPGSTVVLGAPPAPTSTTSGGFYQSKTATSATAQALSTQSCQASGGNQPHANIMPSFCLSFIIALNGIYPSQQ